MSNNQLTQKQELEVAADVIKYLKDRGVEGIQAACILKTSATHVENRLAAQAFFNAMQKSLT
ncbi:hypothetical protein PH505_av00530 [Pseudoalteromonas distincta]|uniref:hypothetical protein n=1 Tax=Pseudoalteromonas distincta TaxID=77608 RepID=UPI00020A0A12|nr:hypothetical protein [Pseudoalteromonas distincta]EGI73223.1 hypothetical protein PH505_av00530 [Pseudoalteromonas distincta]